MGFRAVVRRRAASYTIRYLRVVSRPDHASVKDKIKMRGLWLEFVNHSRIYILGSQVEKPVFLSRNHDLKNSHFLAPQRQASQCRNNVIS